MSDTLIVPRKGNETSGSGETDAELPSLGLNDPNTEEAAGKRNGEHPPPEPTGVIRAMEVAGNTELRLTMDENEVGDARSIPKSGS